MMHADATFKLVVTEYPLLVAGVSDRSGSFHLVAFALTSHRREAQWTLFFNDIKETYTAIFGSPPNVHFIMGDADRAQQNASNEVFPAAESLMCFFHVVKNCKDKLAGYSRDIYLKIMQDISIIHYLCPQERQIEDVKLIMLTTN